MLRPEFPNWQVVDRVASSAGSSGGIHYGAKGVGIHHCRCPLWSHPDKESCCRGDARNPYGELRPAGLKDTVTVRSVGLAEDAKR